LLGFFSHRTITAENGSSPAAKVKRWSLARLNQSLEVRGFLSTVSCEFSPVPSDKAVMPNLGLFHIPSASLSWCRAKLVDCI
jgi:hypothetical protein